MVTVPKVRSVSAWASFIKEKELSFQDAVNSTTSSLTKAWLQENQEKIMVAVLELAEEKETAVATFVTPAEFVEEAEEDEVKPNKGIRI